MENPIESTLDDDGSASVAVLGEIDYSSAEEVAQALRDAMAQWSPAELRVDLRRATFMDSTGLGALIEGYRAATDAGSRFVVINPSAGFRRVLTVTGLCELFGMVDEDESTALASATGA